MQYFLACGIALHFADIRMAAATPHLVPYPLTLCFLTSVFRPSYFNIQDQEIGRHGAAFGLLKVVFLPYADGQKSGRWNSLLKSVLDPRMDISEIWIQPINIMLVICLINLTACYQYRILHISCEVKNQKSLTELTVLKVWPKTLLLLDLQSGWGLEKQEFKNLETKDFFSVCFQQNETVSWRGRENNNGGDFFSEKWSENENVF